FVIFGETYIWTSSQQKAFQLLKKKLTSTPVLAYPIFDQEFLLFTDASGIAIGAILSQKDVQDRKRVISYTSRILTSAEKNYSVTEQEYLAVIWAVTYFRQYLHGT
ncbi:20513_t:CDS:2, partial [Gigaspora rosea]